MRKSANNIYKIPVEGRPADAGDQAHRRQPVLAVDVERRQGHRLRGQLRHLEAGRRVGQDERDQARHRHRREGERGRGRDRHERSRRVRPLAVRPARGHLGARTDPHDRDRARRHHARRAGQDGVAQPVAEVVGRRQVPRVRLRSLRAATRSGSAIPKAGRRRRSPTSTTRRARSSGRRIRRRCSTPPPTRSSTATASPTARRRSSRRATSAASARSRCRPTASGSRSPSRIGRCARTSTSCRSRGGEERHISDDSLLYSETNAVWTADGRYLVFTSSEGASNGIATQGGISTTMELWALSLRDQDRDPTNRDIDNEAQGLAAEAAARQNTGRGGGAARRAGRRRFASTGTASRAARGSSRCRATTIGGLTPAPEGHSVALTAAHAGAGGGRGGAPDATARACTSSTSRAASSRACRRRPRTPARARGEADAAAAAAGLAAAATWRSRATAARCTSARAAGSTPRRSISRPAARAAQAAGGGRGGGRGGGGGGAPTVDRTGGQRHGASGHLHRQHRGRSQGAARAGLQRRLAHHEEPLLRPEDARRGLERREGRLRAAPRLPRRRRRAAARS